MNKTSKHRKSKDFVFLWAKKYEEIIGHKYVPKWKIDSNVFKRLQQNYNDKQLIKLIFFAFSEHPQTLYLRNAGFPTSLFESSVNQYYAILSSKVNNIPIEDLELDVPIWNDSRTSYIYSCINKGDINSLIQNVRDGYYWKLLITKLEKQVRHVPKKVSKFYEIWKSGTLLKRKAIRK